MTEILINKLKRLYTRKRGNYNTLVAYDSKTIREAIDEINKLQNERDEARREVCNWSVGVGLKATSQSVADDRGWNCYKKDETK